MKERDELAKMMSLSLAPQDSLKEILQSEFEPFDEKQSQLKDSQKYNFKFKSRDEHLKELMSGEEYDILIIGGGANGAGLVLDAASRGLKCAVVDKYDFASGTSSRSTKMAHGGIRYF